jgi:hypothetical protein
MPFFRKRNDEPAPPPEEEDPREVADQMVRLIAELREQNRQLTEDVRRSEGEKRFIESELIRLHKEILRLKRELSHASAENLQLRDLPPSAAGSIDPPPEKPSD